MRSKYEYFLLLVFCSYANSDNKENNTDTSKLVIDDFEYDDPEIPDDETATTSKSIYIVKFSECIINSNH